MLHRSYKRVTFTFQIENPPGNNHSSTSNLPLGGDITIPLNWSKCTTVEDNMGGHQNNMWVTLIMQDVTHEKNRQTQFYFSNLILSLHYTLHIYTAISPLCDKYRLSCLKQYQNKLPYENIIMKYCVYEYEIKIQQ